MLSALIASCALLTGTGAAGGEASVADARRDVRLGPVFDAQQQFAAALAHSGIVVNPRYDLVLPVLVEGVPLDIAFPAGAATTEEG